MPVNATEGVHKHNKSMSCSEDLDASQTRGTLEVDTESHSKSTPRSMCRSTFTHALNKHPSTTVHRTEPSRDALTS
eukprot:2365-Eustigmatos_ZCMA.PRE.1